MRTRVSTLRHGLFAAALGVFSAFGAAAVEPLVVAHHASAADDEIAVGTELEATDVVQIGRAEIAKGSKVSVTKLEGRQGDPSTVDLALADGQVVKKVGMGTIRSYFRVIQ